MNAELNPGFVPPLGATQTPGRLLSDIELHQRVSQRLRDEWALGVEGLELTVTNGEVTLYGRVRCLETLQATQAVVASVEGVKTVLNRLDIVNPKQIIGLLVAFLGAELSAIHGYQAAIPSR